ncbi:MAG: MipA/OmpV family protein [Candidatus Electrothrix sp. AW5]|nr:MipA/OmpV family protein [Candidatus Electrothrix gigas]
MKRARQAFQQIFLLLLSGFWSALCSTLCSTFFPLTAPLAAHATAPTAHATNAQSVQPAQSRHAAPTFSLGAGAVVSTSLYQGASYNVTPIPMLMFSGKQFFIQGTRAGMHLYQNEQLTVDLLGKYRFAAYETGDSAELIGIKERKGTVEAGVKASLRLGVAAFSCTVLSDVLDEHGGQVIQLRVMKPLRWRMIFLAPYLGVSVQSNDFSTYYYGVDSTEALAGWSEYDLDWTVNWQTGVTFRIGLSQNIMLNTVVGIELLDQDIADSPLVERDTRFFGMLGIAYGF